MTGNRLRKAVLSGAVGLVGPPIGVAIVALVAHWFSGEGNELGSGDPILMIWGMLFLPISLLFGILWGLVQFIETLRGKDQ